jgi:hypothetical protein
MSISLFLHHSDANEASAWLSPSARLAKLGGQWLKGINENFCGKFCSRGMMGRKHA